MAGRAAWAAVAMLVSGCASMQGADPSGACQVGQGMVETSLYLGMARPGGVISRYAFNRFVETEVVPRWKEGFTLIEAQGLWRSEERNITEREPSHVLIRLHDGSPESSAGIEAIRAAYIKAFDQDAVLRTDRKTCADF